MICLMALLRVVCESRRVSWLQLSASSSGLALMLVHHRRDEDGPRSGCTQGLTPCCFQTRWLGLPGPILSHNMGSSCTS